VRSHRRTVALTVGGAVLIVTALIVGSRFTSGTKRPNPAALRMTASIEQMLKGIPQRGIALGEPSAPVTLVEFADPQCPWCARWADTVLPELVQRYVRPGELRILFQGQTFIDGYTSGLNDSERLLRLALAAGQQNRLWNVVELFYANQGTENSGYASDAYLSAIVEAIPGLDATKVLSIAKSSAVVQAVESARSAYDQSRIRGTPSFLLGRTGREPTERIEKTVSPGDFIDPIEALLAR